MKNLKYALLALVLSTTPVFAGPLYEIPVDGSPLEGVQERPDVKNTLVVTNNHGGIINDFVDQYEIWDNNGTHVEIKGECMSACTMYTGIAGACIHDGAFLEFHKADIIDGDVDRSDMATGLMLEMMKPVFSEYIMYHLSKFPDNASNSFLVIRAHDIIANGWMPRCKPLPKSFKMYFNSSTYAYN